MPVEVSLTKIRQGVVSATTSKVICDADAKWFALCMVSCPLESGTSEEEISNNANSDSESCSDINTVLFMTPILYRNLYMHPRLNRILTRKVPPFEYTLNIAIN